MHAFIIRVWVGADLRRHETTSSRSILAGLRENWMATILLLMDTGFAGWIRQALVQNNEQAIVAVTSEQKRCALGDSQWNWLGIWHRSSLRCLVMGMPLLAICAMTPDETVGRSKKQFVRAANGTAHRHPMLWTEELLWKYRCIQHSRGRT